MNNKITQAFCNTIRPEALRQADKVREGCRDCGGAGHGAVDFEKRWKSWSWVITSQTREQARIDCHMAPCPICTPEVERLKAIADKWCWHEWGFDGETSDHIPHWICSSCGLKTQGDGAKPELYCNPTIGSGKYDIFRVCDDLGFWSNLILDIWKNSFACASSYDSVIFAWHSEISLAVYAEILTTPALLMQAITNWTEVKR